MIYCNVHNNYFSTYLLQYTCAIIFIMAQTYKRSVWRNTVGNCYNIFLRKIFQKKWFRVFPVNFLEGGIFHENCMKTKEIPFLPKGLSKMKEFEGYMSPEGVGFQKKFPGGGAPPSRENTGCCCKILAQ